MMKRRLLSLLLILAMVLSLSACGGEKTEVPDAGQAPAGDEAGQDATGIRTFEDDCGREVEIPTEISRIVPSGPLAQIVLFAIAPELLVGLASKWSDSADGMIAEQYRKLPFFGQLYGSADLNVEELAMAEPQLIVDIGEAKDSIVDDLNTLQEQTTIPTVYVSATLETMPEVFRKLGELLGKQEKGEELAQFCESVYDRTLSVMEQVGDKKVKTLYILGEEGLNVLAKGAYHAELIDLLTDNVAVVENPVGKGSGNEVTLEQIALWNPDFILFAPRSIYNTVTDKDTWKEMTAISGGHYIEVPEGPHNWMGSPPSVQRYLGLIWLTAEMYPDFCNYDVKAEIMEYYRLFYDCALTDAQYEALTANAFLK